MASSPYRRRKPSLLRNFWVYRRLILAALVLGLLLWFIATNNEKVTIILPFGLGRYPSTTGIVILLSALVGSLATALILTLVWAIRLAKSPRVEPAPAKPRLEDEDLPPPDYAAKTGDGLEGEPWNP
ncbi:MAG: DUF1049 domain-containing protein [Isosphaeraceae bacterium]|nr:DUF1049 domain-containing protein [Isosphaeraceae bacterium]